MPMKKALALLLLSLLARIALADEAKVLLGLHASKYLFPSDVSQLNRTQKSGLAFGLGYALPIAPRFALEAQALFCAKGAKASLSYVPGKKADATYRNTALSLPLFITYRFREEASPYVALGPEINLVLSHTLSLPEYPDAFDLADNTKKLIVAFNAAAGYKLPLGSWGLLAELRYNRWITSLLKGAGAAVNAESVSFLIGGTYSP